MEYLIKESAIENDHEDSLAVNAAIERRLWSTSSPHSPSYPDITHFFDDKLSRFQDEFKVIKILGRGAFGKVLHTINMLDNCDYAVKMIKIVYSRRESDGLLKILREVKLLAAVSHVNVVRYYASWLEHLWLVQSPEGSEEEYYQFEPSNSRSQSEFSNSNNTKPSFVNADNIDSVTEEILNPGDVETAPKDLILFIQMELCDSTLHSWLEQLNEFESEGFRRIEEKILHCFNDLLRGVEFIHNKGYIHRCA
jgi:translation initiation factor 2-alpha kinase 1